MSKKLICCIGDSLTEGDYGIFNMAGIANVQEKNYPYFLKQMTGCEVKNFGYCGYKSIDVLALMDRGIVDVTGADIVVIILGTNGGHSYEGNSECDLAYIEIVERCQKQAPNAKIFLSTPPHVTADPKKSGFGCEEKVKTAAFFVKNYAKQSHFELIDLFNDNHFNSENEDIMQPNDGVHFSEIGYKTLAEIVYNHIKKYI